jgi:hypothetical protein
MNRCRQILPGRKILQAAGFTLLVSCQGGLAAAESQPAGLSPGTTMTCESEQSIGFRWVKGQWKSTDFIADRYVIVKRSARQAGREKGGCLGMSAAVLVDRQSGEARLSGCYAIRRAEEGPESAREYLCSERLRRENGRWLVRAIVCDRFAFRPDGWFHRTSLHDDLTDRPQDDSKNPLSVSVGHCRTLR